MRVKDFLDFKGIEFYGDENIEIAGISSDSRTVQKNYAFFALSGHFTDGNKFIGEALERGASLIISESKQEISTASAGQIVVQDIVKFMAFFASKFYKEPDKELTIIGITGTNGKTTTAYMAESILSQNGFNCAVFGTINYRYNGKIIEANNTTPLSIDLYRMMREAVDGGTKYLIMEVSSHSLVLGRVEGIEFDIAVFTNLTQDHLDFHKDMDDYFNAKSLLFKSIEIGAKKGNQKFAIINTDDEYGRKIAKIIKNSEIKTYSARKTVADFKADDVEIKLSGSFFNIYIDGAKFSVKTNILGLHNIYNALAASAIAHACGIDGQKIAETLGSLKEAPGRLERVNTKNLGFEIVIDYAHTDDALQNVLSALQQIKQNKIITVFGCGGDRDRNKRPKMGKVAAKFSDFVFITSDNPRTEDPKLILLDIELGLKRESLSNYTVVIDREVAIKEAIFMAESDDIILIAGKGHENYQIIGRQKTHFDDREIASKYVSLRQEKSSIKNDFSQKEFNF